MNEVKLCPQCQISRSLSDFATKAGTRRYRLCVECRRKGYKKKMRGRIAYEYANLRHLLVMHMGGRCSHCGYDDYTEVLDFCVAGRKSQVVTLLNRFCYGATPASWQRLNIEMRKNTLLCCNCQRLLRLGMIRLGKHADCGEMPYPKLNE